MMFKPWLIVLETTNRCNASCFHCAHKHIKKFYDMDFDLYKRIVDETQDYAKAVDLNMYGEPLLYPYLVKAVAYANKKGRKTIFFTNASLLNGKLAKRLLDAGLKDIRFSADGCDKESYEQMRRGLSWNTTLSNIEYFMMLKRKYGHTISVTVAIVKTDKNRDRIKEIKSFWKKRVRHVAVSEQFYVPTPEEINNNMWVSGKGFRCERLFDHLTVKANGELVICCHDYLGTYVMADINKVSVLDGFNSKKFNEFRNSMLSGKKYPLMCTYCPARKKELKNV